MNKDIHIYYHITLMNNWKDIFEYHLNSIIDSDLYKECKSFNIGIIYHKEDDLKYFYQLRDNYDKIRLFFVRQYNDLPIKVWNNVKRKHQLGEGEAILKMLRENVDFENVDDSIYLFFHSKGITKPKDDRRTQISYFYKKGLKENADPEEKRKFILEDMTNNTIWNWKEIIDELEGKNYSYYYYIWNFFWIKGSLLKKFNFEKFKNAQFPKVTKKKIHLDNRHWTALFPVNLYGLVHNIKYKDKKWMQKNCINIYK